MSATRLPATPPIAATVRYATAPAPTILPGMQQQIAPIEQPGSTPAAPARKPPRLSKRLTTAIRLIASGECKTVKAASERVGMNYTHLCEQLRKPQIQEFIAREASGNISRGVLRASARLVELIDAQSEHVAAKVSERIAEHAGILKPQGGSGVNISINNNMAAGYVIDMTPWHPVDPVQQLTSDQQQTEAKPLIDQEAVSDER